MEYNPKDLEYRVVFKAIMDLDSMNKFFCLASELEALGKENCFIIESGMTALPKNTQPLDVGFNRKGD